jgi:hypothetical protein
MRKNGKIAALLLAAAAGLGGCATAAKPEAMIVMAAPSDRPFPQAFQRAMCVRNVTGGEATNPLWVSKVDNNGFKSALDSSLVNLGLAGGDCAYPVDANLLGLSQPSVGFDLTVTSHVNYKVYDRGGNPVLLETVDTPYTASMSDSLVAFERLRMSNEGSIRTSIQKFLDKLRDTRPAPAR